MIHQAHENSVYTGSRLWRAKKTARCRRVLVVTELFNIAVNHIDAKKYIRCGQVLVVIELVASGTQFNMPLTEIPFDEGVQFFRIQNIHLFILIINFLVGWKLFKNSIVQGGGGCNNVSDEND